MDFRKSQKLKANRKRNNLIHNILVHSLTTLTCVFLCSYGFWFPLLISSAESFAFVSLPRWKPFLVDTETMFLVVILILIILVGDSWFRRTTKFSSSPPVVGLYDEYVEWSKRLRGIRINSVKESNRKDEKAQELWSEPPKDIGERKSGRGVESKELPTRSTVEDLQESTSDEGGQSDELPTEKLTRSALNLKELGNTRSDEGGESDELPREELTRRVEEFITRVNRRRWIESSLSH